MEQGPFESAPVAAPLPPWARALVLAVQAGILGLAHHWLLVLNVAVGLFVLTPWLAPVLMHYGWEPPARLIYSAYSYTCHQLPQRSYFLFGESLTYSLGERSRIRRAIPTSCGPSSAHPAWATRWPMPTA